MLARSGAAVQSARARVAAARATVVRAESEVTKADTALHRVEKLHAKDAATEEELETVQAASKAAHAQLDAAQAQLDAAREGERQARSHVAAAEGKVQQSGPVDAQVAAAEAQARMADSKVAVAQAALEQARLQLSYTEIKAPRSGIVSDMAVEVGQAVAPGSLVVELVPEETYVVAEFKETDVGRIKPGQPAEVEVDTFGGQTFEGVVASVSPATGARFSLIPADNATGNFVKVVQRVPVKIRWKKPPGVTMRAGLSAEVTVHVGGS
jgi:membrane fusion protein (multidrug efflux system)